MEAVPNQLSAAEIEELAELIKEANNVGSQAAAFSGQRLRACVQIGERLIEWRKRIGHGEWERFADEHWPDLNRYSRWRWQQLAIAKANGRLNLDDARGLRHAYALAGIIPDTAANTNAKASSKQGSYLVHIARLVASLQHIDVPKLSPADRSVLALRLQPVVLLHNQLTTDDSQDG